jgi:hypothetical protein
VMTKRRKAAPCRWFSPRVILMTRRWVFTNQPYLFMLTLYTVKLR